MLKFGIIGCGRISKKHLDAINEIDDAKLVSVCDTNFEKAELIGKQYSVPYYSTYDEMLQNEDIDIINILTPSGYHPLHTIDIVKKYQKNIICEKPMALRLEDADEMIRVCDEYGVRLFIIKQNRYNLPVIKAKEAIDRGKFGKLIMGTVRVRWCRKQEYYDQDDWRGTWRYDGGVIANQASHHIDLLEWLFGEPVSVMAMNDRYLVDIEADDTCAALIRFKSGAIGIIEATTATRPHDLEGSLSILGEKGSIVIGGFAVNKLETWNFSDEEEKDRDRILNECSEIPPNVYGYGHKRYLEHVIDCCLNNKHALVDGLEGRKSLELINAIYESAETSREVTIRFQQKKSRLGKNDS